MTKTIVHTPTGNLQASISFYKKLQFKLLSEVDPTLFTDGRVIVEINPDRYARAGLKMFAEDWSAVVESMSAFTNVIAIENGFLLSDPNNVKVYLQQSFFNSYDTPGESFGITGNFAGISIETTDMQRSLAFWEKLGFQRNMGGVEQGWMTLMNADDMNISIMNTLSCPHLFFNPSFTYFNAGHNLDNIKKIREAGISITEEITHFNKEGIVDNIIIRDPGGFGFFVFND